MVVPARQQRGLVCMIVTTLVLALLSGCCTRRLWRGDEWLGDDRGLRKSEMQERIDSALPWPAQLVLPLTGEQRQRLASMLPLVDEATRALVVTLPQPIDWADLHAGRLPGEAARVILRIGVDIDGEIRARVRLAGEQGEQSCAVQKVAVLPAAAGAGPPFPVHLEVVRFDGRSTIENVLWTPVAVVGDAMLAVAWAPAVVVVGVPFVVLYLFGVRGGH